MTHEAALQHGNESDVARRTLAAAFVGFFIDMFDVYLPIIVLAPAMIYFLPNNLSAVTSTTIYYLVFVAALIGRPVGALVFGRYSDKIGRKRITTISVSGFAVLTFLMAVLPGYSQWGLVSLYILIAFRFICGIFLGGEYTAANPLAIEYAPPSKRGLYGGIIATGFGFAYIVISLITSLMLAVAPLKGVNSPYVQWGWRIPFFLGVVLAGLFIIWFNKYVPESEIWKRATKVKEPLKALFSGENFRTLIQVLVLTMGAWLTLDMVTAVLPGMLIDILKVSVVKMTHLNIIAYVAEILLIVAAGVLSQRLGRRRTFVGLGLICAILCPFLYYAVIKNYNAGFVLESVLIIILIALTCAPWGVMISYSNERFHTSVRSVGYGIGYSWAVLIPSFYSFYLLWLKNLMPYQYTEIVLLVLGGLLIIVGALMGPETRDVVFEPSKDLSGSERFISSDS